MGRHNQETWLLKSSTWVVQLLVKNKGFDEHRPLLSISLVDLGHKQGIIALVQRYCVCLEYVIGQWWNLLQLSALSIKCILTLQSFEILCLGVLLRRTLLDQVNVGVDWWLWSQVHQRHELGWLDSWQWEELEQFCVSSVQHKELIDIKAECENGCWLWLIRQSHQIEIAQCDQLSQQELHRLQWHLQLHSLSQPMGWNHLLQQCHYWLVVPTRQKHWLLVVLWQQSLESYECLIHWRVLREQHQLKVLVQELLIWLH
jgi:hypothetical protein